MKTEKRVFEPRVRFNWGYWDGRLRAELRQGYRYNHFDKVYLAGEHEGMNDYKTGVPEPETSNEAWKRYQDNHPTTRAKGR